MSTQTDVLLPGRPTWMPLNFNWRPGSRRFRAGRRLHRTTTRSTAMSFLAASGASYAQYGLAGSS